jgi:hypothetical protein
MPKQSFTRTGNTSRTIQRSFSSDSVDVLLPLFPFVRVPLQLKLTLDSAISRALSVPVIPQNIHGFYNPTTEAAAVFQGVVSGDRVEAPSS